jgi:DNA polymerase-3 subunit delta
MAKSRAGVQPILNVSKDLKRNKLMPVYYFFGEDTFSIETAVKDIETSASAYITSDFDREIVYGENKNLVDILNFALAFPFGSEKKLIVFKEFEKVRDKKNLTSYIQSPPDFTIIVFIHNGTISGFASEPYKTLIENNYIYEAKELKGELLIEWLINYAASKGKNISQENARFLTDIVGENKGLLETQLEKIMIFLEEKKEISLDIIKSLSTAFKEYTIFDLQNALGKKNKANAFKIAFNMLDKGQEPTFIIYMLTRYFTALTRIKELKEKNVIDAEAARIVGTHPYYFKDYQAARMKYSDKDISHAAAALLKADLTVKTTTTDNKSIISILLTEILQEN